MRKNSVNHKNNQLVYFHGSVRIGFLELDRFVLNDLVLAASVALTIVFNDCLLLIKIYHISKKLQT